MDNLPSPQIESPPVSKAQALWKKWRKLIFGFLGWFLFEGLVWLLIKPDSEEEKIIINFLPLLITFIVLLILAANKETRQVALGVLAAIGVNLVISLIKGLAFNGFCFIPFFIE